MTEELLKEGVYQNTMLKNRIVQMSILASICWASPLLADSTTPPEGQPPIKTDESSSERNFYSVLEDLFGDFEYDLKNGNVTGLRDLAIRNIATSENIPPSFKSHLELILTEKILKTSKTRVLQCLPCKARKTSLNGDQVVITSPDTNPTELARVAKLSGIEHFMDVAFTYQPNGMVISMYITDPEAGNVIWSRSYNSENTRAAAFRRGVDYNQIDEARKQTEYTPVRQHRLTLYYMFVPNIPKASGALSLGYRMMERYDNRKKEVGFELGYMAESSTIVNKTTANPNGLYNAFGFNLSLLFVHAWNFIGEEENYNQARGSFYTAIGGGYASGYLTGIIRGGYEWRLAKHFGTSLNVGYRPQATAFLANQSMAVLGGVEYGLGVSFLF
jgi:hypothetical protein